MNRHVFVLLAIVLIVAAHAVCQQAPGTVQPASAPSTMPAQSQPAGAAEDATSNSAEESSYRYVFVIAPSATDELIRKATLRDVARIVGYLDVGDRLAVVVAGKDKPVVLAKDGLTAPDADVKRALPGLLESVKPAEKPDMLAAMKKAYELHRSDVRTVRSATRRIRLYCPPDPSEELVKLATDEYKLWGYPQNQMRMMVQVTIVGTEFRGFANAIRIAALPSFGGEIELVDPDPTAKPESTQIELEGNRYRVAYVFDTRMADEAMDRVRADVRKSISKLRHEHEFIMVAAGQNQSRVGPDEKFSEPNAKSRAGAVKFLEELRRVANADLLAAIKRAYELEETDKSFPNPLGAKQFLVYLICQSDPSEEVAKIVEEKQAGNHALRHVYIFMYAKEGTAHPNAARMAKATDGRVKIITPEPATNPASAPAMRPATMPAKSQPAGAASGG